MLYEKLHNINIKYFFVHNRDLQIHVGRQKVWTDCQSISNQSYALAHSSGRQSCTQAGSGEYVSLRKFNSLQQVSVIEILNLFNEIICFLNFFFKCFTMIFFSNYSSIHYGCHIVLTCLGETEYLIFRDVLFSLLSKKIVCFDIAIMTIVSKKYTFKIPRGL